MGGALTLMLQSGISIMTSEAEQNLTEENGDALEVRETRGTRGQPADQVMRAGQQQDMWQTKKDRQWRERHSTLVSQPDQVMEESTLVLLHDYYSCWLQAYNNSVL